MNDLLEPLPLTWVPAKISEIADVNPKLDKAEIPDNLEVSFVPMPAVEELTGRIDLSASRRFSEVKKGYTPFQEGDVLFAKITPCMENGKMAIVPALKNGHGFGSTEFHVLRPLAGIEAKYLYYFVSSERFRAHAEHNMTGAVGQRRVPTSYLSDERMPMAPAEEQRRIIAKIEGLFSKLDKGIESLTAARDQLEAYRQSVLKVAFDGSLSAKWRESRELQVAGTRAHEEIPPDELTGFPNLPEGWTYVRLGHFLERVDAGKSFRCEERMPSDGDIGVAKVSAVTWGEYDEDESKTCTDPQKVNPRYFIKEGDFLFSRANTIELVGACVVAKKVNRKVMLSDKTLRLAFRNFPAHFFLYYLRSHLGRREIMRRSTGNQNSMRNIGQDRIRSIVTPMCSAEEADYIQGKLQSVFSSIEYVEAAIQTELVRSNALRQAILKQAFSGRLVKQDPKDEPATVLLERVRAERASEATTMERRTKNGKKRAA